MERILRIIVFALVAFIILRMSTFGWRFWSRSFVDNKKENSQLAERLKRYVYKLAHEIGERSVFNYEKLNLAAKYIAEAFASFGYNVEFQEYSIYNKKVNNIIAFKKGAAKAEEIIILGAHYDTCFNPGADDNASGIATLLELAKIFSNKQTNRSIKFIAFVNEEPPFFKTEHMGSSIYAGSAKQKGENIKAALILETIGYYSDKPFSQHYPLFFGPFYPNKANFIGVVGNFSSRWLVKEVVSNFKRHTQFPIESVVNFSFISGIDFSDHWSFWKEGYPAVMLTDTAFYRNRSYHTYSDTYEKLNYESIAEIVNGLNEALMGLADKNSL